MNILSFSPDSGWPGTIIKIMGNGFSENRDDNSVDIGGVKALVIESAQDELVVVAGEQTKSGPINVTLSTGATSNSSSDFTVLPYPAPDNIIQSGPPRFFHGPQAGTPQTGVSNQPVLVLVTYPTDQEPGSPAHRTALRNSLISRFDQARQYWKDASYGSTTWAMTYTDWLDLPRERRFYFWQGEDIDNARRDLFLKTTRSLVFNGTRIFHGAAGGCVPIDHPNPQTFNFFAAINTGGSTATALRLDGNRLYAGTDSGIIFVFDVTNLSSPVALGSLTIPNSHITDIDISGTHLLVAGREGGVHWINAANPAAMTLVSTIATGAAWAMATKAAGTRGYVGTGTSVQVLDLSGASPIQTANVNAGAWVTDVDVTGNTCIASTDGDGLKVFETTAIGGITNRSTFRNVLRVRQAKLVGNIAYLGANANGLVIVDLSNLAAPVQRGQLTTTKPCYNVQVSGSEAILALGANDLLSVNVSNPDAPVRNGSETPSAMEPDLNALQNALRVAIDSQALIKDSNQLFVHALRKWLAIPGNNLDPFQGVIVVVNGPFLRGQSWTANGFSIPGGDSVTFNHTKGVIYIAFGAEITRIAHEIGHWLGMWDIYTEWYSDGTYLEGTAGPWCTSGTGDRALFCGHQINDIMRFYRTATPNQNVIELAWSPTSSVDQTFDILAHDALEDTDPNRIHILKLKAAEGLYYYVEVRQKPNGISFDQSVPIPAGELGLVLVTRVTQGTTISNTFERPIMLFGELKLGQQVVDAGRDLIIRVESRIQDRPLVYRVRVQWNQPIPGDLNGKFDMTITPWNTNTWETVDVWIDSLRNNPASGPEYEFFEGNDKTKPRLNGDRPWVHHKNKIYARIRNTGPQTVDDVYATCYVTSPPGIGDNGQWATLATKNIASLPGNGETVVDFDWAPSSSKHTCLKVAILPKIGEIEPANNTAQENVGIFDSAASSSHQPVVLEAEVRSPFVVWRKVDAIVRGLPLGWHAVVDKSWVWLDAHGTAPLKAIIWTDRSSTASDDDKIPQIAYAGVEGWTSFDHRYLPIGGFLAAVKAVRKVKIEFKVETGEVAIYVSGRLDPALANVPITIELIDENGNSWLLYSQTGQNGHFYYNSANQRLRFHKGVYSIQVFVTSGGKAAEAESVPLKIAIR